MRINALKTAEFETPVSPSSSEPVRQPLVRLSTFSDKMGDRAGRRRQLAASYGVAALLELAVLFGVWNILSQPDTHRDSDDATELSMVEIPPTPAPPKPDPQPPKPVEPPKAPPRIVHPIMRTPPLIVAPPMSMPLAEISPPAPSPPAPSSTAETVDRFQAEVRAAIQAAIVYPPTARMMKQQGRAKVAFTLTHGHAEGAQIIQSSGIATIDVAALTAVRDAAYPPPPPEMAGKPLSFAVFVIFSLTLH